jgi:hypothetical protein
MLYPLLMMAGMNLLILEEFGEKTEHNQKHSQCSTMTQGHMTGPGLRHWLRLPVVSIDVGVFENEFWYFLLGCSRL